MFSGSLLLLNYMFGYRTDYVSVIADARMLQAMSLTCCRLRLSVS
jgi:hypothetical protein